MAELSKYDTAKTYYFPLIDFGATDFEDTPVVHAVGDTQRKLDGAAFGNTTNAFAHAGNGVYSITLSAAEHQAAQIVITIIDQTSPKAWKTRQFILTPTGMQMRCMRWTLMSHGPLLVSRRLAVRWGP